MRNDIERIFFSEPHRICQKWLGYFPVYEGNLARFRNTRFRMVEFGVSQGGSFDIWEQYFGTGAELIGVDILPETKRFERANVRVHICDQGDRAAMSQLAKTIGSIDVLLDDGGHTMAQQIITFETFYPNLRDGGVYICEDVHTSYQSDFGGGLRRPGTFIEYMKNKVDELNAWHAHEIAVNEFSKTTHCIAFYESMIVVEKKKSDGPIYVEMGF